MSEIGGNIEIEIEEISDNGDYNANGKLVTSYKKVAGFFGFLDLISGESQYDYKAKIKDSTHVFVSDYIDLSAITEENTRAVIDGEIYDILLIDDPMKLHEQIEIYLKYIGGQNGE